MSRNLILIASYPKSGNTWVRLVLEKLLHGRGAPFSINDLSHGFQGHPRRLMFDAIASANAADLLPDEIDELLPLVYRQLGTELFQRTLMKVHDCAAKASRSGQWIIPPDCVQAVLYLVRHPFDVAVSYARFSGITVNEAVEVMSAEDGLFAAETGRLPMALPARIGSWSGNVRSWTGPSPYHVVTARYEDLYADPQLAFQPLIQATGFRFAAADIRAAIEQSSFERVRGEERDQGFKERPSTSGTFFRAGRPQSWREEGELNEALRETLVRDHGEMMRKFGYRPDGATEPMG